MNLIRDYWINMVTKLIKVSKVHTRGRSVIQSFTHKINNEVWRQDEVGIKLSHLGYSENGTKMTQLKNQYMDPKSINAAKREMGERLADEMPRTSVGISMIGNDKDPRSQGHCIRSLVLTHLEPQEGIDPYLTVDIFYRSTEAIKKFAADLIFLHNIVVPKVTKGFDFPLKTVRFYFSNIFISPLFFSILYQFHSPIKWMELVKAKGDKRLYKNLCSRAEKFITKDPDYYSYRSRRAMHHIILNAIKEGKINEDELKSYLREVRDEDL